MGGISGGGASTAPATAVSPAARGSARSRVSSQNRANSGSGRSSTPMPLLLEFTVLISLRDRRCGGRPRRVRPLCAPPVLPAACGFSRGPSSVPSAISAEIQVRRLERFNCGHSARTLSNRTLSSAPKRWMRTCFRISSPTACRRQSPLKFANLRHEKAFSLLLVRRSSINGGC